MNRFLRIYRMAGAVLAAGFLGVASGYAADRQMPLGFRAPEAPAPETLPETMIQGTAARAALFSGRGRTRRAAAALPAAFDLREEGAVTAVRDQNPWGTCWMFASIASFESCLLKMYGEKADFSEWNCLTSHLLGDRDILNAGGNPKMADVLLTAMVGPALEVQDPYRTVKPYPTIEHTPYPASRAVAQVVYWNPPYDSAAKKYDTLDADYIRQIKEAVYTYGAVTTAYWHNYSGCYNAETKAYYDPTATYTNHAVAIIGWDDNFSKSNFTTEPSRDGAWLVKNSWGDYYMDTFYISYDDPSINPQGGVSQFRPLDPAANHNFSRLYTNDSGKQGGYLYLGVKQLSVANVFTAQAEEQLSYVAYRNWNTTGVEMAYTLSVYKTPKEGNPSSGTRLIQQAGTLSTCGSHLIPLDSPVRLTTGETFSIVLTLANASEPVYFPTDSSVKTSGCSYYTTATQPGDYTAWTDLNRSGTSGSGTLQLRGVATPAVAPPVPYGLMDWLAAAGYLSASGSEVIEDGASSSRILDYEAAVDAMQKTAEANSRAPLDIYLAGCLPEDSQGFITRLTFDASGAPVLTPEPRFPGRQYTLYSKTALSDAWVSGTADLKGKRFFKHAVSWPSRTAGYAADE